MPTRTVLCIAQFVGGPSDGLELVASHFRPRNTLHMPAAATSADHLPPGESSGPLSTIYRLKSCRRIWRGDRSATCLRYEFVSYERPLIATARDSGWQNLPPVVPKTAGWLSTLGRKCVEWLFAPLDYPLKLPVESSHRRS